MGLGPRASVGFCCCCCCSCCSCCCCCCVQQYLGEGAQKPARTARTRRARQGAAFAIRRSWHFLGIPSPILGKMAGIPEGRAKWLHHIPASQVATPNDGDRDVMEDARADCSAVRGVFCSARGAGNRSNAFNPRPKTVPWRRGAGASHQQRADPRAYRQPSSLLHRCASSKARVALSTLYTRGETRGLSHFAV